jgi:zinc protease
MVLDTPDKANVSILAFLGLPIQGLGMEAEDFAMQLAVQMLGGGPGSRLHNRLREKSGLSYSVGARWNASLYDASALFSLSADVAPANASQAEAALREELQRSVLEGFSAAEVEAAKRQLLGYRQRSRSGDAWAMTFMNFEMDHQIPRDARERNDALIALLTAREVNDVWRKHIRPDRLVWGIFGDASTMK